MVTTPLPHLGHYRRKQIYTKTVEPHKVFKQQKRQNTCRFRGTSAATLSQTWKGPSFTNFVFKGVVFKVGDALGTDFLELEDASKQRFFGDGVVVTPEP